MKVSDLGRYFECHRTRIVAELLSGTYRPSPVKRVEIPRTDGGVRKLDIPTPLDRVIQQAILLVLSPLWDEAFSDNSFGFWPRRSTHGAVAKAQNYLVDGYTWVVAMDLENFFDRVNHDVLMGRVARRVEDKRLLKVNESKSAVDRPWKRKFLGFTFTTRPSVASHRLLARILGTESARSRNAIGVHLCSLW